MKKKYWIVKCLRRRIVVRLVELVPQWTRPENAIFSQNDLKYMTRFVSYRSPNYIIVSFRTSRSVLEMQSVLK